MKHKILILFCFVMCIGICALLAANIAADKATLKRYQLSFEMPVRSSSWTWSYQDKGRFICEGVFYDDCVSDTVTANGGFWFVIQQSVDLWEGAVYLEEWSDEQQSYCSILNPFFGPATGGFSAIGKFRLRAEGMNGKSCPYEIVGSTR